MNDKIESDAEMIERLKRTVGSVPSPVRSRARL
jgi:hypothetical protein